MNSKNIPCKQLGCNFNVTWILNSFETLRVHILLSCIGNNKSKADIAGTRGELTSFHNKQQRRNQTCGRLDLVLKNNKKGRTGTGIREENHDGRIVIKSGKNITLE